MKTIMKQASFWQNRHVEPFYQSPVVSDEEEHKIHQIYSQAIPLIGKTIGTIGGGIAGAYAAHKNGHDVIKGAATGAGAGLLLAGTASDMAGQYARNKKILKKRRDSGQPIFGDLEKAHYSANKPAPALPVRNIELKTTSDSFDKVRNLKKS